VVVANPVPARRTKFLLEILLMMFSEIHGNDTIP